MILDFVFFGKRISCGEIRISRWNCWLDPLSTDRLSLLTHRVRPTLESGGTTVTRDTRVVSQELWVREAKGREMGKLKTDHLHFSIFKMCDCSVFYFVVSPCANKEINMKTSLRRYSRYKCLTQSSSSLSLATVTSPVSDVPDVPLLGNPDPVPSTKLGQSDSAWLHIEDWWGQIFGCEDPFLHPNSTTALIFVSYT